jgi:hypothetical protein
VWLEKLEAAVRQAAVRQAAVPVFLDGLFPASTKFEFKGGLTKSVYYSIIAIILQSI